MEEVGVPFEFHKFIIGQKGRDVRKLMQDFDVNISIPAAEKQSDVVTIRGPPANVSRARDAVLERVSQLEQEKEDRVSVWGDFSQVQRTLCLKDETSKAEAS